MQFGPFPTVDRLKRAKLHSGRAGCVRGRVSVARCRTGVQRAGVTVGVAAAQGWMGTVEMALAGAPSISLRLIAR